MKSKQKRGADRLVRRMAKGVRPGGWRWTAVEAS